MKAVLFLLLLLNIGWIQAQDVRFVAKGPQAIKLTDRFYLTYEINKEGKEFSSGDLSDFTILGGPSQSSSSSVTIVNGKMERSSTISLTYILSPKKEGKFTISPAAITIDGKTYKSNSLTIEVVKGANPQSAQETQQQPGQISDKDLFVRIEVNKTSVYKGEPLRATVKLYTRVQLQQLSDVKFPQFNGFWRENIEMKDKNVAWNKEGYNGEIYHTAIVSEFILIPQSSGQLIVDPIDLEVVAVQEVKQKSRAHNPFNDPFFDDFFQRSSYERVNKNIKSNTTKIQVKDIPASADLVGSVKLSSEISKTEVKTNESVSLKIKLTGKGNLKMVEPFKIDFPADFESFEPEIDQKIKISSQGISGSKTFEYLLIPRQAGNYTIPSLDFTVFNPATGKLEKLRTESYELKVKQSNESVQPQVSDFGGNKVALNHIGKDIRYIKTANISLSKESGLWFESWSFYAAYILSTVGFVAALVLIKKQKNNSADIVGAKKRKAGNMARKRLKVAGQYLQEDNSAKFYDELLKANWKYLEDKLSIQKSEFTKEKIRTVLTQSGVSDELLSRFIAMMEKCEMAQYAPITKHTSMAEDYEQNVEIISQLEAELKR
jgi:hypothetical protein